MARDKRDIEIKAFADHHVITQPNPLRKVLRRVEDSDKDDPIARAEKALAGLSGEFKNWMTIFTTCSAVSFGRPVFFTIRLTSSFILFLLVYLFPYQPLSGRDDKAQQNASCNLQRCMT